jgi:membrane-associated protein
VPVVRTFVPILAGVGQMEYKKFLTFNILGGILWGASFPLLGYSVGKFLPNAEKYITYIILLIIVVSFLPIIREVWKQKLNKV